MKNELLKDKKLLEGIFSGIQDGVSFLDINLKILHVNHTMNEWYSHSLPLTGKQCFQVYHGKSEPCEICPSIRAIKKGTLQTEVMPFTDPNGKIRSKELFALPLKDEKDNVIGVIEYIRDITEKKELLKNDYGYLQKLDDSQGEVIFSVKIPELVIEYVSPAVEKIFGYKPDECIGKEIKMFYIEVDGYYDFNRSFKYFIKEGRSEVKEELLLRRKNGEIFPSEIMSTFLKENEKIVRCISIVRDIPRLREEEERLRKQNEVLEQKNLALREVLSQVEFEKKEMKDNVIANAENLLLPIIEKIRLKEESRNYTNLLGKSLKELTSSFGVKLTSKKAKLTSREIEICNMIKNGLASLEIADLLKISSRTVEKHRNHIRTKLGIRNKDINLTSFLKTL